MPNPWGTERLLPDGDEIGTPPSDRSFRPDIQGLRALAVSLVVLYHAKAPLLTGGFVGVDVFFVISGFVITGLLLRERATSTKTSIPAFYARRARRILPAATLVIVVTVIATYHFQGFLRGDEVAVDGRWAAVFLSNIHEIAVGNNYLGALGTPSPLLHFWSLAVEEQFYLFFPLLFALLGALFLGRRHRRVLTGVLCVIIVSSFALSVLQTSTSPVTAFYSPLTRAWELAIGALLAVLAPTLAKAAAPWAALATWIGLAGIVLAAVTISGATPYPGSAAALPVISTALVIGGGAAAPRRGAELVLGLWVALRVGEISYALYLWHYPLLVLAAEQSASPLRATTRVALIGLAVVLALVTYHAIENPIRHATRLAEVPARSLILGLVLIVGTLGICTLLIDTHSAGGHTSVPGPSQTSLGPLRGQIVAATKLKSLPSDFEPPLVSLPTAVLHSPAIPGSCIDRDLNLDPTPCFLGDPSATRTMVVLGDSQAIMWSSALDEVARHDRWRLVVLGRDACPPWLTANHAGQAGAPCAQFHAYAARTIASLHPRLVIITGAEAPGVPVSADAAGLTRLLGQLRPSVDRTVVLGSIPWFSGSWRGLSPPECLAEHENDVHACTLPVATLTKSFGAFDEAMRSAAVSSGATYRVVQSLFCTPRSCPVVIAHRVVYQDRFHMTWQYATYIAPAFHTVLGSAIQRG